MKQLFISLLAAITFATTVSTIPLQTAGAVTASDWKAGRIIDDVVFTNPNEMSVADIQAFLNRLVPTCDTNGTQPATEYGRPDLTHAQYAAMRGWAGPPYVCLKDYYEVPKYSPGDYIPANNFSGSIPAGAKSAAQIIYDAAKNNNINPKAILVKIGTESAGPLTADTWPVQSQYTYAMGSHCPDSGPGGTANCDRNYAGFSMQVQSGAELLRWYLDNMDQSWWSYKKPYQTNSILWNVEETGCGSGNVYIESRATAALYTYTPYQPNQAALNNMYGLGDGCSAYGNRNFWRVWNDWFSSPIVPDYAWKPVGQGVYTDNTKTKSIGWNSNAIAGERVFVRIVVKNTGNKAWYRDNHWPQVQIGTDNPLDTASAMCDKTWIRCSRAATHLEATVSPGQTATFEFWAKTPSKPGVYGQSFNLVADGLTWMSNSGLYMRFQSVAPSYTWQFVSQAAYKDSTKSSVLGWNADLVAPGQRVYAVIKAKNTGNVTWYKTGHWPQVQIGTALPNDHNSQLCDTTWIRCSRAAAQSEDAVAPGQTATFGFWVKVPSQFTKYGESFNLVADGLTWMNPTGAYMVFDASKAVYNWDFVGQANYTDQTKTTPLGWHATAAAGSKVYTVVKLKNSGNVPWYRSGAWPQVQLATWQPDRVSKSCDTATWIRCTRIVTHTENTVNPGQTATFAYWANIPSTKGQTNGEALNLVADGLVWLPNKGIYIKYLAQ